MATSVLDIEDLYAPHSNLFLQPRIQSQVSVRSTAKARQEQVYWKRNLKRNTQPLELERDFSDSKHTYLTEGEAVREANRCLKCADAPCQRGCPASVDVKAFISCIANGNYYGAAKLILSSNPCGLSCGMLCTTSTLCGGCCNLSQSALGAINISGLQEFAIQKFRELNVRQRATRLALGTGVSATAAATNAVSPILSASLHPRSVGARIGLVGAGPASISCATFLARLGYRNIHVYEKELVAGGLSSTEIPEFRIPLEAVQWEVQQMKDLGVTVSYDVEIGRDMVLASMLMAGRLTDTLTWETRDFHMIGKEFSVSLPLSIPHAAVFLGVGLQSPVTTDVFAHLTEANHFFTSKSLLRATATWSKDISLADTSPVHVTPCALETRTIDSHLPNLHNGRVLVLGAGDVAFDCARAAFRCGARRVTICLRKNTNDIRATEEEVAQARAEQVDLLPYCTPKCVKLKPFRAGKRESESVQVEVVESIELYHTAIDGATGKYEIDFEQSIVVKCDFIVSAFGSHGSKMLITALSPLHVQLPACRVQVDAETGATSVAGVYAGGDIVGSGMTVEAVNDGKCAALAMHSYLQRLYAVENEDTKAIVSSAASPVPGVALASALPMYTTAVDEVDLNVTMHGVTFPNPFGLASAPPCTSVDMIQRAFALGWGFAVTKTFTHDDDVVTNVSPRILSSVQGQDGIQASNQQGFMNIELISEKKASYWYAGITELKRMFPLHVVVASIMSMRDKDKWQELCRHSIEAGADMIELNLSCPHGMHEKGMGLALGTSPALVQEVSAWVAETCKAMHEELLQARKNDNNSNSGTSHWDRVPYTRTSPIPVFAKLTPNVTDITAIAEAAMKGGCVGVTAINTVAGVVGFHSDCDGTPRRRGVGQRLLTTQGGLSGNSIRPLALRAVVAIRNKYPALAIMATGGVDSAATALQFLQCGASVVQVCSAVMNQDLSVIQDYTSGLRALLYKQQQEKEKAKNAKKDEESTRYEVRAAAKFGSFEVLRRAKKKSAAVALLDNNKSRNKSKGSGGQANADTSAGSVVKIDDLVDASVCAKRVTTHTELSRNEQVVVVINNDLCINCGRCFAACNDNGYQAICFDPMSHIPTVDVDKCTGCGICESICPVLNCIQFAERDGYLAPNRGDRH